MLPRAPSIVVDMKEGHKIGLGRVKGKENTEKKSKVIVLIRFF